MSPKVSIITNTRNRPDFLRRCILSVQLQTFQDYEHIIIADRCNYAEKVYLQFKEDSRIRFFHSGEDEEKLPNCPCPLLKKFGTEVSESDIFCYCDDDNIFLPNHLEKLFPLMSKHDLAYAKGYIDTLTKKDVMGGDLIVLNQPKLYFLSNKEAAENYWDCPDNLKMMHTRKILDEIGGWRNPPGHSNDDLDFIDRMNAVIKEAGEVKERTSIYYIKAKSRNDSTYLNLLQNIPQNQIYVYPDFPSDFSLIGD